MKKMILVSLAMMVTVLMGSVGMAQQTVASNPVAYRIAQGGTFASPFAITVTSNGQMSVSPGTLFTEGTDGITMPSLVSEPKPIPYPLWAVEQGWQGGITLAVEVRIDGSVGEIMVMQSSGHASIDQLAQNDVSDWRFHPAVKDGNSIVECVQIPIKFQIKTS